MANDLLGDFIQDYRKKALVAAFSFKDIVYRLFAILLTTSFIVWLSVFIYVSFYYSYVPTISHIRPVHLEFSLCQDNAGLCSNPTANVSLTHHHNLLRGGQPYNIILDLEIPESETNRNVGMFMVHLKLSGKDGRLITSSRRSAMLRYKSQVLHFLSTMFFSPLLLTGPMEEKQTLKVEMFSEYLEKSVNPVTNIWIEIESRWLQLYSSKLRIQAEFTGLRYFMFYWPVLSASVGISLHVIILSFIVGYIWYRILNPNQIVVRVGLGSGRNNASSSVLSNNAASAAEVDNLNANSSSNKKQTMEQRRVEAMETLQKDRQRKLSYNSFQEHRRHRSASFGTSFGTSFGGNQPEMRPVFTAGSSRMEMPPPVPDLSGTEDQ